MFNAMNPVNSEAARDTNPIPFETYALCSIIDVFAKLTTSYYTYNLL